MPIAGYHFKSLRGITMDQCREAKRLYESGESLSEIGRKINLSVVAVKNRIKIAGGALRCRSEAAKIRATHPISKNRSRGASHYNWHGGKTRSQGYAMTLNKSHPSARMGGYVPDHILVIESVIGRHLENGEIVHHVNGDKTDNTPSNLRIVTRAEHVRIHKPRLKTA